MQGEKVVLSETQLALLEQLNPGRWQRMDAHQRTITNLLEKGLIERDLDNDTIRITAAGTVASQQHVLVGSSEYALLKKAQRKAQAAVETKTPVEAPKNAAGIKSLIRPFGGGNGAAHAERLIAKSESDSAPERADEAPVNEENGAVQPEVVLTPFMPGVPEEERRSLVDDMHTLLADDPRPPVIDYPDDDDAQDELEDWQVNIDLPIPFKLATKPNGHPVDYMALEADCPDGDCIHDEILTLISVMYPETADAVDILKRAKVIERRLGL